LKNICAQGLRQRPSGGGDVGNAAGNALDARGARVKVRVRVGKSRIAGHGLFTLQDIHKDTRIMPYVGERIGKKESVQRLTQGNAYIFTFSDQYDIDGNVLGNAARYINHSCDPNCEVEITRRRIWIVARRMIRAGEELSYNYGYGMEHYGDFPCTCKATHCVGYILAEAYWGLVKKNANR
jgi:SET domain-containing protein